MSAYLLTLVSSPSCTPGVNPRNTSVWPALALASLGLLGISPLWGQQSLTLNQTLTQVVEANLRLKSSSLDHQISVERAKSEWAIFEPVLLLTLAEESNERQNSAERFLSQRVSVFDENNNIYSGAIEGVLPTGGKLRMGTQIRRLDNNLQIIGRNEYESYSGVTLTQPLLRDLGWKAVAAQIKLAAADSNIALQEYRGQLALVLSEAEMAFWELYAAGEFVALSQGSVDVAETILGDNRQRLDAGKTTELEVLQAEAGVALRRSHLADAKQRQADAAARLNAFLGRRTGSHQPVVPVADGSEDVAFPVLDDALAEGFRSHPAYLSQMERIEQAGIRLAYAKNERLPQIDLKASYGLNGLSSTFKGTFGVASDFDYPSWYVGLEMRVPMLLGKRERHQQIASKLQVEQSLLQLSAIEIELVNGLQSLFERVASLRNRVQALELVVNLNRRVLKNEQDSLLAGKSESRRVLQAEEDLSEASLEALSAQVELRRAMATMLVQQGAYLKKRGFELSESSKQ